MGLSWRRGIGPTLLSTWHRMYARKYLCFFKILSFVHEVGISVSKLWCHQLSNSVALKCSHFVECDVRNLKLGFFFSSHACRHFHKRKKEKTLNHKTQLFGRLFLQKRQVLEPHWYWRPQCSTDWINNTTRFTHGNLFSLPTTFWTAASVFVLKPRSLPSSPTSPLFSPSRLLCTHVCCSHMFISTHHLTVSPPLIPPDRQLLSPTLSFPMPLSHSWL